MADEEFTTPIDSPHVCARCAAQGTSCCSNAEGVSGPPLTPGDIVRIATISGFSREQFVLEREVDDIEQAAWEEDDPVSRGLVRAGKVHSLARARSGIDCIFLGERGCTLGDARPLHCQRFPFRSASHSRELEVKPGGYCLAVEEAESLSGLLVLLGTSRKKLRALDRQLQSELGGDLSRLR